MRRRRACVIAMLSVLASVLAAACGKTAPPPGGVMLAFSSDMSIPKDVDTLHVEVTQSPGCMHARPSAHGGQPRFPPRTDERCEPRDRR